MVLFLTAVLVGSCLALAALLYAKHWELTTGRVILGNVRPRVGEMAHRVLVAVEKHLPMFVRMQAARGLYMLRVSARAGVARALVWAEHTLENTLRALQRTTMPRKQAGGNVSSFLREVAEHKKHLMRRRNARIVED